MYLQTLSTPKMRLPVEVVAMPTSRMQRKGFFSSFSSGT